MIHLFNHVISRFHYRYSFKTNMPPPFSDGTIESIMCEHENLSIEFLDWQEQLWMVTSKNVLAFKAIGAVGCEESEMYEKKISPPYLRK